MAFLHFLRRLFQRRVATPQELTEMKMRVLEAKKRAVEKRLEALDRHMNLSGECQLLDREASRLEAEFHRAFSAAERDMNTTTQDGREHAMPATFTLWVRDTNPNQMYLMALLMRVCREHPSDVPAEFKAYVDGNRARELAYRTSPNSSKGGTDVTWTLS
jgi:hypothetical protein